MYYCILTLENLVRYRPEDVEAVIRRNAVRRSEPKCARFGTLKKSKARKPWICCYLVGPAGFEPATP